MAFEGFTAVHTWSKHLAIQIICLDSRYNMRCTLQKERDIFSTGSVRFFWRIVCTVERRYRV